MATRSYDYELKRKLRNNALSTIRRKVNTGEGIDQEEALFLLNDADLLDLAPMAQQWHYRHNPERRVTFVVDTNLNDTNVRDGHCTFCAFYRADDFGGTLFDENVMQAAGFYNRTTVN